jgi:hypothetical protein
MNVEKMLLLIKLCMKQWEGIRNSKWDKVRDKEPENNSNFFK